MWSPQARTQPRVSVAEKHRDTAFVLRSLLYVTMATLISRVSGPLSNGFLRLALMDVIVNPVVRFNYFNNLVDMERCMNGTRKIVEILGSRALRDFKFSNWFGERDFRFIGLALPLHQTDFPSMSYFYCWTVSSIWHYHGGCHYDEHFYFRVEDGEDDSSDARVKTI
ncbi:hypothetical protein GLYMA_18G113700v4 [Glycine max]|uniref:Uncharacterized protein n=1 Tax=Glycine max TaxID=3847 RepID=K7MRD1_SOYBN|nr:hypothetical protein JHK87_049657 [Glycine soja]KAG4935702.1 hypothetical protein JHK85_050621 [Glycine max]KAG5094318.1 hypothetical protein JHK84_049906 [Glycine max]KAH1154124.1 hypothetical protein GYH30_049663 [Glycine max]KAH1197708.1 (R)-mandelonitrile lyase-like [Glycine max]